ncbi:replicative DNA helicase [Acinetobacter higginsii]|uniref:replicative DNA helicase n=1 Tax=Acinetobacter higginsii TaxID=70347 RepID=UPI001F4A6A42|nr:DnaB-like helicase C-terminal domain-containing protein [Acinetobacter higginsii]MCH7381396.1 AAA family ATPase [Acinetobacter higginsii]
MSNLQNIAMEQAVLTALMTTAQSLDTIGSDLTEGCFFASRHKQIYMAICELSSENKPYDVVFVADKLNSAGLLEISGGEEYLLKMMAEAPSSYYNAEEYIAHLRKLHSHRQVVEIGKRIAAMALDTSNPDVFAEAENILGQVETYEQDVGASFKESLNSALEQMIEKSEARNKGEFTGVKFNLPHLDHLVGTIQKGHFCVVGGRPGTGKSTLAQMLSLDTAYSYGEGVLFVSAEMDKETLANRMFSAISFIPYNNLHNAELYDGMLGEYAKYKECYQNLPIHIEPKQKPTIGEVRAYARRAKRKFKKLGCIVVDYLQLLRDPSKSKDRFQEVSSISRELKSMAKEFECPVIALVQLNRESEKGNKPPKASDIKESGQIEQDADQIILVHPVMEKDNVTPSGCTDLIVVKNRHGKKGTIRVRNRLDTCRFACIEVE